MPTLVWIEGWEHGVLSNSGAGIISAVSGSIAASSVRARTGTYALRANPTAASGWCRKDIASGPAACVVRFYLLFEDIPAASVERLFIIATGGNDVYVQYYITTHKLRFYFNGGSYISAPDELVADTWYRIDIKVDVSANPHTLDVQVDGVALTQATNAEAATTITNIQMGASLTSTCDMYYDDLVVSYTAGDYPIGAGGVIGLYPDGAGTSNLSTGIEDDGSVDVHDVTNPANIELDEVPMGSGVDYIQQVGVASTNYAAVTFADTVQTTIHGGQAFLAYMSAAASPGNSASAKIYDEDGLETAIYTGDMSETSLFYKSIIIPPPAGGWDMAAVNILQGRVGYATDYAPVPYWYGLMVQIAYGTGGAAAYSLSCEAGSFSESGIATTLLKTSKIVPDAGSFVEDGIAAGLLRGYKSIVESGEFTYTGTLSTLLKNSKIVPEVGTFTKVGIDVNLLRGFLISIAAGAIVLSGTIADLIYSTAKTLSAGGGTFVINGQSINALKNSILAIGSGSFVESGTATNLFRGSKLSVDAGAIALAGQIIDFIRTYKLTADTSLVIIVGKDATITYVVIPVSNIPSPKRYDFDAMRWGLR